MTPPRPTKIELHDRGSRLVIAWSDGPARHYSVRQLRDACPCATCREKRSQPPPAALLPILTPQEARPLTLVDVTPIGSYAYALAFSDGHDTGIYTLEALRELGRESGE